MSRDHFARRLQRLRISRGFRTMREFAQWLDVNENTYARYERGTSMPLPATLDQICTKLGISSGELLDDTPHFAAGPEPLHTALQGFADDPEASELPTSNGAAEPAGKASATSSDRNLVDAKVWRLAAVLARAQGHRSAAFYKATAHLFIDLRGAPFGHLASLLHALDEKALSGIIGDELDAAIAALVRHFDAEA